MSPVRNVTYVSGRSRSDFIMRLAAVRGWVAPQRDWLIAPIANHL